VIAVSVSERAPHDRIVAKQAQPHAEGARHPLDDHEQQRVDHRDQADHGHASGEKQVDDFPAGHQRGHRDLRHEDAGDQARGDE
jgi:hypothetical protein